MKLTNNMKKISSVFLFVIFFVFFVFYKAMAGADIYDSLDVITYTELQISAIATNMYGVLKWSFDDKSAIRDASKKNIQNLDNIKYYIDKNKVPLELVELKKLELNIIDRLKEIYNGIEYKKPEEIAPKISEISTDHDKLTRKLTMVFSKYRQVSDIAADFNTLDEEVKLIRGQEDLAEYMKAVSFMDDNKYNEAYEILARLDEKYKGDVFSDCIMLRMSDCLLVRTSELRQDESIFDADEKGLKLLSKILERKRYSPVIHDAFYRWRTTTQYNVYGMSEKAEIPNETYNRKRWEIIQLIKRYLVDNPTDKWAKTQVSLLLTLPNIRRSGEFGNDNLVHWGKLYDKE